MDPRISIITLGVTDLDRSTRFYRDGLGFPVHEIGSDSITFFLLERVMLALYPRDALAREVDPDNESAEGFGQHAFTLAHNVASRPDVDAVLAQAGAAGGRIIKPAADTFLGRLLRVFCRSRRLSVGDCHRVGPPRGTNRRLVSRQPVAKGVDGSPGRQYWRLVLATWLLDGAYIHN